jgi:putative thioredoxin
MILKGENMPGGRMRMADKQSSWVIEVGSESFEREVIQRSREVPVVVDFWAPWCGPCQMLGPLLERLVAERQGDIVLAKVNIDEAQDLAAQFGVSSIPLVIAFRHGQAVLDFLGLLPEPQIRQFLDRISPTPADRLLAQAGANEKSNPAEAESLYRRALSTDPRNEAAAVGLARLLVDRRQDEEARNLLAEAGGMGEMAAEVDRLMGILDLRQLAGGLPDEAALRQRLAAQPGKAQVLYELGCVLAVAGRYEEALGQLLAAAEADAKLAAGKVRQAMVSVFQIVGPQSALANDFRNRLAVLL